MINPLIKMDNISVRQANVMAFALGCLLTLSFAPFNIFPFGILAPAGLIWLIFNQSPRRAACLGFLFGMGLFGTGIYWIFISIHQYGDVPSVIALALTIAMVAVLALYTSATCYLTNRSFPGRQSTHVSLAFAGLWVLMEWVRTFLFTGFPWLLLGYSQTNSPLRGYAPLISVFGVSFASLLSATFLLNAYFAYRRHDSAGLYKQLYLLLSIWIIGGLTALIPWTSPEGKPVPVSLVQGNIPQSLKWSPEHLTLSLDRYRSLSEPLFGKSKLIIWPEAAIPVPLQMAANYIDEMDAKARATDTRLVLGIPINNTESDGYFNTVISVGNDLSVYQKRRLVPFGEYIPFKNKFGNIFDLLHVPMSNMVAGKAQQPLLTLDGIKIYPSICYEIAFPLLMHASNPSIGLLLTVTNDAWFGHSTAQAQHLQMAQMRAIELARPLLFVGNDGITAIIEANGSISESLPPHTAAVLNGQVQPRVGLTPWMTNGLDPLLFIIICILIGNKYQISLGRLIPRNVSPQTIK